MERKRHCGFVASHEERPETVVWARRGAVATECPKSLISAASVAWIEEFYAWKLAGKADYGALTSRQLDAFGTLEREMTAERDNPNE